VTDSCSYSAEISPRDCPPSNITSDKVTAYSVICFVLLDSSGRIHILRQHPFCCQAGWAPVPRAVAWPDNIYTALRRVAIRLR